MFVNLNDVMSEYVLSCISVLLYLFIYLYVYFIIYYLSKHLSIYIYLYFSLVGLLKVLDKGVYVYIVDKYSWWRHCDLINTFATHVRDQECQEIELQHKKCEPIAQ